MKLLIHTGRLVQGVIFTLIFTIAATAGIGFYLYKNGHDTIPFVVLSDNDGHTTIQPISHEDPELDAAWKKAQREAVEMWNESSEDINIVITEDSPNAIKFSRLPGTAKGFYLPTASCLFGECVYSIHIRDEYYTSYNPYHIKWRGRYIIAHELGHALGLNDLQEADDKSIMHYQWRNVSRTPTQLDIRRIEDRINAYESLTGNN